MQCVHAGGQVGEQPVSGALGVNAGRTGSRRPGWRGRSRMLALGRALMAKPRLLLLDERRWACPKLIDDILAVLHRLNAEGLSMLLVEQNAKLTFEAATTCLVMENGEVAMTGPSARMSQDPRVRRIYLGL